MVNHSALVPRFLAPVVGRAIEDTRVVLLVGPRQSGKSTLARGLLPPDVYRSLDDAATLTAAVADPKDFLARLPSPGVIDEIQRVPLLLPVIKLAVDRDSRRRVVLTGSADVFVAPGVTESLAGRIQISTLWPFAQCEIERTSGRFIDKAFAKEFSGVHMSESRSDVIERIVRGGYPEAVARTGERRTAFYDSYVTSIALREVRDISNIPDVTDLPRVLRLLAARAGSILNMSEVSRSSGIAYTTLTRYLSLLEATYLFWRLPAWAGNLGKRLLRHPKIVIADSGVAAALQGIDASRIAADEHLAGPLFENFAITEVLKLRGWSDARPSLFHFRSVSGDGVDLVLELRDGTVVGIEVKAGSRVDARDFRGLRALAEALGRKFRRGIVLYTGSNTLGFGRELLAVPVAALWQR